MRPNQSRLTRNPQVFAEEREFFSETWGMTDPQIAERFGMTWEAYCYYIRRHRMRRAVNPEYEAERAHAARFGYAVVRRRTRKVRQA